MGSSIPAPQKHVPLSKQQDGANPANNYVWRGGHGGEVNKSSQMNKVAESSIVGKSQNWYHDKRIKHINLLWLLLKRPI